MLGLGWMLEGSAYQRSKTRIKTWIKQLERWLLEIQDDSSPIWDQFLLIKCISCC